MQIIKKPKILYTISLGTDLLLYLTGTIALGCKILLNSKKPFLIKSKCLTILKPPEVLPAEPPINIKPKNINNKKGVQDVQSAVTNPVVETIDTTWNKECRITPSILLNNEISSLTKKLELKKKINATTSEKKITNFKYKLHSSSMLILLN